MAGFQLTRKMPAVLIFVVAMWCGAWLDAASLTDAEVRKTDSNCHAHMAADSGRCGDGFCVCYDDAELAICNGLASKRLHYVPRFPPHIKRLCFTNNNLVSIQHEDFFQNVSHISTLDLRENNLKSIHPGTFSPLKKLTHLYLNANPELTSAALSVVLTTTTLKLLDLESCNVGRVSPDVFQNVSLPRLKYLNLDSNQIEQLNFSVFTALTTLKHLEVQRNRLLHVHINSELSVQYLDLGFNFLNEFPETCDDKNRSFFPHLRLLALSQNVITSLPEQVCLPQLRNFELRGNSLDFNPSPFNGNNFPVLRELDLAYNNGPYSPGKAVFSNLTHLKFVSFESDQMLIGVQTILQMFLNCPQTSHLDLSGNFFDPTPDDQEFPSVKTLELVSAKISTISPRTFCSFTQLWYLNLRNNFLLHLPDGAFDCLTRLTQLNISYNNFVMISPDTFGAHLRGQLVHLDLSANLFQCGCDLLWLQAWMKKSPHVFDSAMGAEYLCFNYPHTTVPGFVLSEQACLLSHTAYVTIVTVLSVILTVLMVAVGVSRYHWHLRLLCFEACRGPSLVRMQRLRHGHFDYDVFVSYDSEDFPWVRQHLVPELEGRLGLRLCLHERDFTAGYIVDNIARCVESSKKILMLFSNHFVRSRWCQFEVSFCLRHVMDYEDALLVVCLDEVASRDLTSGMMAVLKTTTYLQWTQGQAGDRAFFWQRLAAGLQEIMPGPQTV